MTQEAPPKPRKSPQQIRSQLMVNAIIDSCKKILVEFGEESLTLPLLEAVSGVGKGSIYQYFPNLDAVVAALYERECQQYIQRNTQAIFADAQSDITLAEFLTRLIDHSRVTHRELQQLHTSFYRHYCAHYDINQMYGEQIGMMTFINDCITPLVIKERPEIPASLAADIGIMVLEGVKSQFFAALEFFPERIHEESFKQYLINIGLFVVHQSPLPTMQKPLVSLQG